ncbi:unnamed protein product, partial [Onchocerca ochengi]|uniref:ANF_receptor domain-containing protein n=1 Tax=Onchocerca ochengi TaxID=42157 RepID=A0A182EJ14_ONCOC
AETVSKMDNHQKIAFHLVMADSEEPENGEDLFREIFNDVKLVTLSSFTSGIISTLSSDNTFERGSIYAIIGFEHNANELCSMLKIRSWPKFKISLAHFFENFELFSSVAFQAAYFD